MFKELSKIFLGNGKNEGEMLSLDGILEGADKHLNNFERLIEPVPRGDGGMQAIDHATCRDYFAANFGCGVCLAVCPFSQYGYERLEARFKGNPNAPQFRIPVIAEADIPLDAIEMAELLK